MCTKKTAVSRHENRQHLTMEKTVTAAAPTACGPTKGPSTFDLPRPTSVFSLWPKGHVARFCPAPNPCRPGQLDQGGGKTSNQQKKPRGQHEPAPHVNKRGTGFSGEEGTEHDYQIRLDNDTYQTGTHHQSNNKVWPSQSLLLLATTRDHCFRSWNWTVIAMCGSVYCSSSRDCNLKPSQPVSRQLSA